MTPDITELTIEERQNALWGLSQVQLKDILNRMMLDCRQTEIQARLDALTVFILQVLAPVEDFEDENDDYQGRDSDGPMGQIIMAAIESRSGGLGDEPTNADLLRRLKAREVVKDIAPDDAEDTDRYCGPI